MIPKKPQTEKKMEEFIKKAGQSGVTAADDPQVNLVVKIPQSLRNELKIMAATERKFIRNIVIDALQLYSNTRSIR